MTDPRELEAKMAFDQAFASLDEQRSELESLQAKAKDVIGLLTLAATFLGAFGNVYSDSVLGTVKNQPGWAIGIFVSFPTITAIASIYVMFPRSKWFFTLDGHTVRESIKKRPPSKAFANAESFYLAYVAKISQIAQQNVRPLKCRKWALWTAFLGLLFTVAITGTLVLMANPPNN